MKRSKMINLLTRQFIKRGMASDLGAKVAANEILTLIEKHGMLPPDNGNGSYIGIQYMSTHLDYSKQPEYKWDKE